MERENFVFYRSYWEQAQEMNKTDRLKFLEALCELALNGKETELKGTPKIAYISAKPQIEANNKKYQNGLKGGVHGKKGGRPKKGTNGVIDENPKKTPNVNDNVNVNENDNENDNENVNENDNVFGVFQTELNRQLSDEEKKDISIWIKKYGEHSVTLALRSATLQGVSEFAYINTILKNQEDEGY